MKKKKIFLLIIPILLVAVAVGAFFMLREKFQYNEESAVGNTPGNLNNGGLFCEYEGIIYFANPYDKNKLYSMNADCSNAKKLNDESVASINVNGNYIYYAKNKFFPGTIGVVFRGQLSGVYRCKLDGTKSTALYEGLSGIINLSGNHLYYQEYVDSSSMPLCRINIDGKEELVVSETECNPSSIYEHNIYFSKTGTAKNICMLDSLTETVSSIITGTTSLTDMRGEYLYYIDETKKNSLMRIKTGNKIVELLSEGRCTNYNIYGNKIFYIKEIDNPGLYRMNLDGSQKELITSGEFANIYCTSQYTFFQFYNTQGTLYRVPTTGTITAIEEITIK